MEISGSSGSIPITSSGEVKHSSESGTVDAPPSSAVPIDLGERITNMDTPGYFIPDTVGHIVNTIV